MLNLHKWYTVTRVLLDFCVPTRLSEGRGITPRVIVESEEIAANGIGSTVEVSELLINILSHISCSISYWNLTVSSVGDVVFHVAVQGLDVWCGNSVIWLVDDLVTINHEKKVGVVGECIDSGEDALKVILVV